MLFTERKAVETMFQNLETEKHQIKQQAREEIANIEQRQEQLLERLKRIDETDRAEVDLDGLLNKMVDTTQELSSLIPEVPAGEVLERAAEMIAEQKDAEKVLEPMFGKEAKSALEVAATIDRLNRQPEVQKKITPSDVSANILCFLKEQKGTVKPKQIEKHIFNTTGRKWNNFSNVLKLARDKYPDLILKEGHSYKYQEGTKEHELQQTGTESV